MAVTKVHEIALRRRSQVRDTTTTHIRSFRVFTNDPADGTAVALTANDGTTAIPASNAAHPSGDGTIVHGKEANPDGDSATVFIVEVEYSNAGGSSEVVTNPLDRPAEVSYGSEDTTEPYFIDKDDTPKPVTNSAGDAFENERTRDKSRTTIQIVRNEATHDPAAAGALANCLNDGPANIKGILFGDRTLKLKPITATEVVENVGGFNITYFRKTYNIVFRPEGWDDVILDVGFNELNDDGKPVPIVDATGMPVRKPWPLDGTGHKKPNPTDTPETITRKPYGKINFGFFAF